MRTQVFRNPTTFQKTGLIMKLPLIKIIKILLIFLTSNPQIIISSTDTSGMAFGCVNSINLINYR